MNASASAGANPLPEALGLALPLASSSGLEAAHTMAVSEPVFQRAPFESGDLAFEQLGSRGIDILNPLCFGITLRGLAHAHGRKGFLTAMSASGRLTVFDQRGLGDSGGSVAQSWEERGAEVWEMADAMGIERAILYGVFDAGLTALAAAHQQPERVLGLILNLVPPAIGIPGRGEAGLPLSLVDRWFPLGAEPAAGQIEDFLRGIGVSHDDAATLKVAWHQRVSAAHTLEVSRLFREAGSLLALPAFTGEALIIEPQRVVQFAGWGAALLPRVPRARLVTSKRSTEALGAIQAFASSIELHAGREASALSPSAATAAAASEAEVQEHRHIIVALDEDESGGRAVEMACRLGSTQGAEIILARIGAKAIDPAPAGAHQAQALGEAIVRRHRLPVRTAVVSERSLSDGLMKLVATSGASLLIIGGSLAERDARRLNAAVGDLLGRTSCEVLVDRRS